MLRNISVNNVNSRKSKSKLAFVKIPRQSIDDSSLLMKSPTRDMFTNHLNGPSDKRFVTNEMSQNVYLKNKFKKQPVLVDMAKQMRSLEQLKESHLVNRHVYDLNEPIRKHTIKYPSINPQYYYNLDTIKPRSINYVPDFSKQMSPNNTKNRMAKPP